MLHGIINLNKNVLSFFFFFWEGEVLYCTLLTKMVWSQRESNIAATTVYTLYIVYISSECKT